MLLLSAIVTLMSVDASHRVHHMPGLFYGLILILESGLFGSFTALNFFHWFLFWELSLIPAFFLIKLWGGPRRGPAATQFFVYTMAGSVALLISFLAIFLSTGTKYTPGSMDFGDLAAMAASGALTQMVTAHLGAVMPWLAIGVLAGFAVKVPHRALPHMAARRVCRGAFARHHAAHRRNVEDGRLRPAAHRAAHLRRADRRHAHAAAGSRRRHRGHGRLGRGRAKRFETRLRLLVGESPGLLPARHLRAGRSGFRRGATGQPGRRAQRRHPADVQSRHHRSRASSGSSP